MVDTNSTLSSVLLRSRGLNADLIRFCISDASPHLITDVIHKDVSPVSYANKVMAESYTLFFKEFFEERLLDPKLPKDLIRAWMYESLVAAACAVRSATACSANQGSYGDFLSLVLPYMLRINHPHGTDIQYCGLSTLSEYVTVFIEQQISVFKGTDLMMLKRLIGEISHIDNPNWFLYDKKWQKVLMNSPRRLRALRNFFHVAIVGSLAGVDNIERIFEVTESDVLKFTREFIAIQQDPHLDVEMIRTFLSGLVMYFDDFDTNDFFTVAMTKPYAMFKGFYDTVYPQQPAFAQSSILPTPVSNLRFSYTGQGKN